MPGEDRLIYKKAQYVNTEEEEEDIYSDRFTREDRPIINVEKLVEEEPIQVLTQVKRVSHPRLKEWKGPQSLNRKTPRVFGTLFDRLKFLETRAKQLQEMIEDRTGLHKDVIAEINNDIEDKEKIAVRIADVEEKRNFKLDVSILRRDKRFELLQYWRDIMELKTELRQVLERIETERNIVGIFEGTETGAKG